MEMLTEGVQFDTIAREWRCKWSSDNDKKSLQEVQKVLDEVLEEIKKVDGVKGVQ
jgi:ribosome recycling factor